MDGRQYQRERTLGRWLRHTTYKGSTSLWRYPLERMQRLDAQKRLHFTRNGSESGRKRYLDELEGETVDSLWDDISPINSQAAERLGYPTQKPVALLERILKASSNENDLVLDPFCGCGTTIHAAEKLNRRWIGIDVTHLAVGLIRDRLTSAFPQAQFEVIGVPRDLAAARELARADKHEFQLWALSMIVGAQPFKGGRKGADGGVDGYIWFQPDGKKHEKAVVSIKGGDNVDVRMIRDLIATVDRENAKVGVFVTLAKPTRPMISEAAAAGFYESPHAWPRRQNPDSHHRRPVRKATARPAVDRPLLKIRQARDQHKTDRPGFLAPLFSFSRAREKESATDEGRCAKNAPPRSARGRARSRGALFYKRV